MDRASSGAPSRTAARGLDEGEARMPDAPESTPSPSESEAQDPPNAGAPEDLKSSFRDALARKAGRNSHTESHLEGRHIGSGNNDTHKRQFRRKSG
jgi:hypothetical protein